MSYINVGEGTPDQKQFCKLFLFCNVNPRPGDQSFFFFATSIQESRTFTKLKCCQSFRTKNAYGKHALSVGSLFYPRHICGC